jgi:hypothetical protein
MIKIWFDRCIRSKTMLFNAGMAGLIALEGVFNLLQPYVPGNVFAWASVALTVGNAMLRVVTTQSLKDK